MNKEYITLDDERYFEKKEGVFRTKNYLGPIAIDAKIDFKLAKPVFLVEQLDDSHLLIDCKSQGDRLE
jgi:hypothetical protein